MKLKIVERDSTNIAQLNQQLIDQAEMIGKLAKQNDTGQEGVQPVHRTGALSPVQEEPAKPVKPLDPAEAEIWKKNMQLVEEADIIDFGLTPGEFPVPKQSAAASGSNPDSSAPTAARSRRKPTRRQPKKKPAGVLAEAKTGQENSPATTDPEAESVPETEAEADAFVAKFEAQCQVGGTAETASTAEAEEEVNNAAELDASGAEAESEDDEPSWKRCLEAAEGENASEAVGELIKFEELSSEEERCNIRAASSVS